MCWMRAFQRKWPTIAPITETETTMTAPSYKSSLLSRLLANLFTWNFISYPHIILVTAGRRVGMMLLFLNEKSRVLRVSFTLCSLGAILNTPIAFSWPHMGQITQFLIRSMSGNDLLYDGAKILEDFTRHIQKLEHLKSIVKWTNFVPPPSLFLP